MTLYHYQEEDLPFFLSHKKAMILYEPRLGKTYLTTHIFAYDPECNRVIVCCPKNAFHEWRIHFEELFPTLCNRSVEVRIIRGKGSRAVQQRQELWTKPTKADLLVYITTFAAMQNDLKFLMLPATRGLMAGTYGIIGDEVHKQMRNRKNKSVELMRQLVNMPRTKRFHPLSGTLANKGGPLDFWPILNIINRLEFSSYWKFAYSFMEIVDGAYGKEFIEPKNLKQFWSILDRYSRRRFKHICRPDMPKVQRSRLKLEPTLEQINMVNVLKDEGFIFSGDSGVVAATSLEQTLRFRQIAACPRIFGPDFGYGVAIEDLTERLLDEDMSPTPDDRHVVIFSEFRTALDLFAEYLSAHGFQHIFKLHGGLEPEEQHARIKAFRETKGIMLCTSTYAEAFSLSPAQQCFHIGYSWDPNVNRQAEDRLVPQQGDYTISSMYYTLDGIDNDLAHTLDSKSDRISITINRSQK